MGEWVRFFLVAVLLITALAVYVLEVIGIFRFGYMMNRIHAAGVGDTLGLLCVTGAMMIAAGLSFTTLKLLLLIVFMWLTSPSSTHFLSQIELNTNPHLSDHVRMPDGERNKQDSPED